MYILKKTTSCLDIYHFLAVMTQCVCMVNTSRRSSSLVHRHVTAAAKKKKKKLAKIFSNPLTDTSNTDTEMSQPEN